jgi:hypothetical protein
MQSLLFDGMFGTQRSERLGSFEGIAHALAKGYFSLPPSTWYALILAWLGAVVMLRRDVIRQTLPRAVRIGAPLGIGLFLLLSPYDEIRFIYPSLVLLFVATVLAVGTAPLAVQIAAALVLLGLSLATNFVLERLADILPNVAIAMLILVVLASGWQLVQVRWIRVISAAMVGLGLVCWLFINWHAYVNAQPIVTTEFWAGESSNYGSIGAAWKFVRQELPPDAKLAYANTFYVYPLYGFDLRRPVVYAPVRSRVKHIHDLSPIIEPLSGERIVPAVARHTSLASDKRFWMDNLRAADARYILICKPDLTGAAEPEPPVELTFAEQDPARFHRVFDNEAASVFEILR